MCTYGMVGDLDRQEMNLQPLTHCTVDWVYVHTQVQQMSCMAALHTHSHTHTHTHTLYWYTTMQLAFLCVFGENNDWLLTPHPRRAITDTTDLETAHCGLHHHILTGWSVMNIGSY